MTPNTTPASPSVLASPSDPYARLKAYAKAGARIRCGEYDGLDIGWRNSGIWFWNEPSEAYEVHPDDLHLCHEYAQPQPAWSLPPPPAGQAWHRDDWTAEMLPEGYRPLLLGEARQDEDEWSYEPQKADGWRAVKTYGPAGLVMSEGRCSHHRTRRPLPSPAASPDPKGEAGKAKAPLARQEGGSHYKDCAIQPVEFITANRLTFLEGCVIKRVCRHRRKAGAEDIRKAIHELELILALEYPEGSRGPGVPD